MAATSQQPQPAPTDATTTMSESNLTGQRQLLPLTGRIERANGGYVIRVPVRAEHIEIARQIVVKEEVVVRKAPTGDQRSVTGTVRREELAVEQVRTTPDSHDH